MSVAVSSDRPIARLLVRAGSGRWPDQRVRRTSYAPPGCDVARSGGDLHEARVTEVCERVLRAVLTGSDDLAHLEEAMHPDVVVWTPTVYARSRDAALEALAVDELGGDALSDVQILVTSADVVPPRVYLEWQLVGRFTNPFFVDDDLLVEPTGRLVETSGMLVVTFVDDRVVAVHCYYDDLALLEQLVTDP